MSSKIKLILIASSLLLLSNCTIQKRTVKKGYFVQWNFKQAKQKHTNNAQKIAVDTIETKQNQVIALELPQETNEQESELDVPSTMFYKEQSFSKQVLKQQTKKISEQVLKTINYKKSTIFGQNKSFLKAKDYQKKKNRT